MVPLIVLHLKIGPYINRKNYKQPHRRPGSYIYVSSSKEQVTCAHFIMVLTILAVAAVVGAVVCEPTCSKFEYEKQTLEKVIRMEFAFERQSEEYKELKHRILDILQQVKDERKDLEHEKANVQVGRCFLIQNSFFSTELLFLNSVWFVFDFSPFSKGITSYYGGQLIDAHFS